MTVAEATPELDDVADRNDRAFLGHPKGLGYLAFVEAASGSRTTRCRRCSCSTWSTICCCPSGSTTVAGLGWLQAWRYGGLDGQPLASAIFGDYTSLVYLTPILGGFIADRLLGRRVGADRRRR